MALRDTLKQSPAVGAVVAVLLLVVAGVIAMRSLGGGAGPRKAPRVYYIDLDTGALTALAEDAPPGPNLVRAYVFACGDCADDASRFVSYVQSVGPKGVSELAKAPEVQDPAVIAGSTRVAAYTPGEAPQWIPMAGPDGEAVRAAPWQRCAEAVPCAPPR